MKKFLSVFIPVILLTATVGVYVVNHYCMITGKTTANYTCCSQCTDDCCKKDIKVVRLTIESIKQSDSKNLPSFDFTGFTTVFFSIQFTNVLSQQTWFADSHFLLTFAKSIRTTVLRI